jgi:hypothetical protein
MNRKDTKNPRRTRLISVGAIFSAIVMGAGLAPIYFFASEPSGFLQNVGNLGQFISGLFAPIAFVWVVVAVMLQSRELELQREELSNSRRALELQHEELRKTVEQHVQQTKIMTEELGQRNQSFQTGVVEEMILHLCARLIDIHADLTIHGKVDHNSRILSPRGPVLFSIGEESDLLSFYRQKNYSAFFDYVHRNIISSIGFLEQADALATAARAYGGGGVGRTALAFVMMLFDTIEERIRAEGLTQLDARLSACNFSTVKAIIDDLQDELVKIDQESP